MKTKIEKNQKIVILLFFVLSLIPIIVISFFSHPCADDYNYSIYIHNVLLSGGNIADVICMAAETSKIFMNSWQGLYSSAFLQALQPGIWGENFYWLTTVIMLALVCGGTAVIVRSVAKYVLNDFSNNWIWISLVLAFFFIHTMPFPVEGFFWYNGAINYVFFWAGLMALVAQYIVLSQKEKVVCRTLLLMVMAFVLSGGNHVVAFAALLVEFLYGIYLVVKQKKYLSSFPFAIGVAGFIWNLTAYGTTRRKMELAYAGNPIKTMLAATVKQTMILNEWINFSLVITFVLLTPFLYKLIKRNQNKIVYTGKMLLLWFLVLAMIMLAMWCVPYQAMGNFGAGRIRNVLYMTFVVMCLYLYGYFLGILVQSGLVDIVKNKVLEKCSGYLVLKKFGAAVLTIMVMGFVFVFGGTNTDYGTGLEAMLEMSVAKQYDAQMEARLTVLNDREIKDANLAPLTVRPMLLYFDDIETDVTNWKNVSLATYYGKNSVKIEYP